MEEKKIHQQNLSIQTVVGGPVDVNTYVIGLEGSDACVLIDPGAEVARVAKAVAEAVGAAAKRSGIARA